ncbi:MAG: peptidase S10 [Sandaracinaceae bacterium]|nr:peptidase S10 [Sandaracinaceae bacterium]
MSSTSADAETTEKKDKPRPVERTVKSQRSIEIAGEVVRYTATAGTLFLKDDKDEPRAEVFYVAYTRDVPDPTVRPVTFAFNGGPGSASVWLHLGALGPRRVEASDADATPPPPNRLVDNEHSILDVTDLVFIDPVGTGWSRVLGDVEASEFHGVKEDVASVAEVIQRWTSRNGRWASPRFLAGESYGATRAASLAAHLATEGMMVNGVVLVSAALMFQTLVFETGNDLPYVLYLPGYAATAAYHDRLVRPPKDRAAFLREVERFAIEEYAPALMLGAALPVERRDALAETLGSMTGLDPRVWRQHELRVGLGRFCRELLRDEGRIVGRLDSRFTGFLAEDSDDPGEEDPSLYYPYGPYTTAIQDYLCRELGYEEERRYEVLSFSVNEGWKWTDDEAKRHGFINAAADLRRAMVHNPHLRVLFASGYYDLATPYFASVHTARHLGREPSIRAHVAETFYEAGHMMYLHEPSRGVLRDDLLKLIRGE